MVTFQTELQTYENALPAMLKESDGKFVVIRGTEVCKVLPTYEEALDWAYDRFGLERFFVKQINAEEAIAHFSRDLGPCGA
ncbi:MAG: hypothetical protein WAQ05_08925 [Rubrivivax sp.]